MMNPTTTPNVILVDDAQLLRDALQRRLERKGFAVRGFSSGEEAVRFVRDLREKPRYAFIDHVLRPGPSRRGEERPWDGIITTQRLMEVAPSVCVTIFSGNLEINEGMRQSARRAGARRCIYKKAGRDAEQEILEIISHFDDLLELHQLVDAIRSQRERIAATLREIPVGTLVLDREWYPWVISLDWRRIEEKSDQASFTDIAIVEALQQDSARVELINQAFEGTEGNGFFLCAVTPDHLKYLQVKTRPIRNDGGNVIACSVSMVDETQFGAAQMSTDRRLQLILQALGVVGYSHCRVYERLRDNQRLRSVSQSGELPEGEGKGHVILLREEQAFEEAITSQAPRILEGDKISDSLRMDYGGVQNLLVIPLCSGDTVIGLLEVDRGQDRSRSLQQADVQRVRPYAAEVARVLQEARTLQSRHSHVPAEDRRAEALDRLNQAANPEDAMQILLQAIVELTHSVSGHVRVLIGGQAVMIASTGQFSLLRPKVLPLDDMFWTVPPIKTGRPIVIQNIQGISEGLRAEMKTWSAEAREAFKSISSFAVYPLTSVRTLGSIAIHADRRHHFSDERRATVQYFTRIAATICEDLLREKQLVDQRFHVYRTIHNFRQPNTAMRFWLHTFFDRYEAGTLTLDEAVDLIRNVEANLQDSEQMVNKVVRFLKRIELRLAETDLGELARDAISLFQSNCESIELKSTIEDGVIVALDRESIRQSIKELLTNAAIAMRGIGMIQVTVSRCETTNYRGEPQPGARLVIEDNGPGVPEEIETTLFDPAVTLGGSGTGFGLASVRQDVLDHKGQIWHEKAERGGARFVMILPRALSSGDKDEA